MPHSTTKVGRVTAYAAWSATVVSVSMAWYVWRNPHQLIFLNGGLPLLWGGAALVSLTGSVLALYAVIRSPGRRTFPTFALAANLAITVFLILCPVILAIRGLLNFKGPGWH